MAPVIMGNDDRPELGEELTNSFCRTDPGHRRPLRARDVPLRQPRRPGARADAGAHPAVLRRRDRAAGRRRVRPRARCATARSCSSTRPATARTSARRRRRSPRSERSSPRRDVARRRASETPPRTSSRTRRAATCRRGWTGRSSGSTGRSSPGPGLARDDLLGGRRLQDLLSPGGRIYYETHLAPLLLMQGSVREIAVEIVRADGTPPARAAELRGALARRRRRRRGHAGHPHDGLRRDRPAPLRAGARAHAPARAGHRPGAAAQPAVGRAAGRRRPRPRRSPTGPA